MTEVQEYLDHSKNELQEMVKNIQSNSSVRKRYENDDNLYFKITKREKKHFQHSNNVCFKCWDKPGYTPCHEDCQVPVPRTDHCPVPELIGVKSVICLAFGDEVLGRIPGNPDNPSCKECKCNWTYHMHVNYEWIEVQDQVESL